MGDFTLGCLLGQYDRAQSFDVDSAAIPSSATTINSWNFSGQLQASASFQSSISLVHSSGQGLAITVNSRGSSRDMLLRYDYRSADDAYGRWFPDITTHTIRGRMWARVTEAIYSGQPRFNYAAAGAVVVPHHQTNVQPLTILAATVTSGTGGGNVPFLDLDYPAATGSSHIIEIDDVLTQVDPITLFPEFDFQEAERVIRQHHRTLGGRLHSYTWDKHGAWSVPLRYLPDSHADLLNWWWQQGLNLAFTLDTSDSESIHVVRIVNERQPIGARQRPYADLWQGTLQLESIGGGTLAF